MSNIKPKKINKTSQKQKTNKPRQRKNNETLLRNILIFIIIFLIAIIISFLSYIYLSSSKEVVEKKQEVKKEQILENKQTHQQPKIDTKEIDKRIDDIKKKLKLDEEEAQKKIEEELPPQKQYSTDYSETKDIQAVVVEPKKPIIKSKKPKLAIVIDDVVYPSQVRALQNIGYPITMSFLPPTLDHPNSASIAQAVPNHMIHLPLEAMNFTKEEENTLHVGDSITKIEQRIIELKKLYPKAKYINNHTGSKFTSDEESMDKLMMVLNKHSLIFLDSKTTPKTVAYKYAKLHSVSFLSRDIFLDNVQEFAYIQEQLKKAIAVAKQRGYAITIGHPYKSTIDVLKSSVELLNDVEVVYIDKIPLL